MRVPATRLRWPAVAVELLLVLSGVGVYFGVRGVTRTDVPAALGNAADIMAVQRRLGLDVEPVLQGLVDGSAVLMTLLNWVYIWGHWPVIAAVLVWLFVHHPDGYRKVRTTMVVSGGVGLVVFAAYPVAPPRLAGVGMVDTVTELSTAYRVLQPPALVNQYAAMPSLHVGWDLLMGIALVTYASHLALRVIGAVLPVAMVASVVLTANHYVLDAVAGAALVLVSYALTRAAAVRRRVVVGVPAPRRPDPSPDRPGWPVRGRDQGRDQASSCP